MLLQLRKKRVYLKQSRGRTTSIALQQVDNTSWVALYFTTHTMDALIAKEKLEEIALCNIVGCEMAYKDALDENGETREDFYDDMVAHVMVGEWRFCIEIKKETDKAVREARAYVLQKLEQGAKDGLVKMTENSISAPKVYF